MEYIDKFMKSTAILDIEIETTRLLLVPISMNYRDNIFAEFTDKIATYMFPQPTGRIEDTEEFIMNSIKEMQAGQNLQLVVLDKINNEFLGCAGMHHIDRSIPEMGIWIKQSAHGNKYGQEAIKAIKNWADLNLSYQYIKYPVAVKNVASRKIAERLGGKLVREFVGENCLGVKMNEVEYHIFKQ